MGIYSLLAPIVWFCEIFLAFTFTDLEDFMPLLTLAVGGFCVVTVARSPWKKASPVLIATLLLLSLWPLGSTLGLYALARELQTVSGGWPQVMVDDPKNWFGHATPRYDALFHFVYYMDAFSGAWMAVFLALIICCRERFPVWVRRLAWGLTIVAFLVFWYDPGALQEWWID